MPKLPVELWKLIVPHLDWKDVAALSGVCADLHQTFQLDQFWAIVFRNALGPVGRPVDVSSWKAACNLRERIDQDWRSVNFQTYENCLAFNIVESFQSCFPI